MRITCVIATPIGHLRLTADEEGLCAIDRVADPLQAPQGPLLTEAVRQLTEYFAGTRQQFDLPLHLQGTPFRMKCWQALREIPYGETRSYSQQAAAVGNSKASRAVGGANHHNPVMIVVPCHRVIGADGSLTGFGGGLDMKAWLLAHEKKHMKNPD